MRAISFVFAACFMALVSVGQSADSLEIKRYYERNTIFWPGRKVFFVGDQQFQLRDLKEQMAFSKEATLELREFRRDRRRYWITLALAEVLIVASVTSRDPQVGLPLLLVSGIGFTFSTRYYNRSVAHLQRAIWVHNRDVLLR